MARPSDWLGRRKCSSVRRLHPHFGHSHPRRPSPYSIRSGEDADDERSILSMSYSMEEDLPAPSYPGEDTRPTSDKELLGFYAYSFAAEVFVVCGLGAFIPMLLEDLARSLPSAVLAKDHSQPCRTVGNDLLTASGIATVVPDKDAQCVFRLMGIEINTASFAMYTFSISVLVQTLAVVSVSGAADHGRSRKDLLVATAVAGSIATMLFLTVAPNTYLLASLWAILSNACFGTSFVLFNSFLPLLARWYPVPQNVATGTPGIPQISLSCVDEEEVSPLFLSCPGYPECNAQSTTPLLGSPDIPPTSAVEEVSSTISSRGVGIGYVAAIIVQILSILILQSSGATNLALRLVLFFIGLWWLTFTLPAALWLRPRPGPPLRPENEKPQTCFRYLSNSLIGTRRTIMQARRLKDVLLFLCAWFMISDAIATVSGTSILFAKTALGMAPSALAMINVVVTLSGIVGAMTWPITSNMMQLRPSQTILICICLFEAIPLYGLLGYVPAVKRLGFFGLQQQWEMYPLGAVYGLVLGGLSSYCRSLYGELIPNGSEAAFYALYAITDKGSSILGPIIVDAITDATGDIRPAFWFLAVLIGLPIPIMYLVDIDRGKREASLTASALMVEEVPQLEWEDEEADP
ncbi:hypothetical protein K470DRAFT_209022 [Piedraia hortae CBS 480.64]|uniref:Autophagy-related protein n=1 Tax=Piedraia hortae CBS 480.64 TaxID=1314780 RepID=A0A6A7CAP8_9PEZI|nr:hypothetical protein K470DRAFT_209022 [Piedraia hortae CBS 480.64]